MKKYLVLGVLAVLFAISLSAAENAKIKLPDGVYMYDSWIEQLTKEEVSVRFEKCFVAKNNIIYSFQEAMKKIGVSQLNKLFTENKKYKILFGGENIGKIYNVNIGDDGYRHYEEELYTKNMKEGPAYRVEGIYVGRLGSVARHLAVPEKYKVLRTISFKEISKEEVDKILKLVKEKLLPLVKNRKELKKIKINEMELVGENIDLLDKISYRNHEMYIGIYSYVFKNAEGVGHRFEIVFSVKKNDVYVITSNYEDETLRHAGVRIHGMLDVDGCGGEELIIEKGYGGLGEAITNIEIYKQKADGNWTLIQKNKWREET